MVCGPEEARTILLLHIISVRPSKQPLMVRTLFQVYMELCSFFLFLQEQIKDIIIIRVKVKPCFPWFLSFGNQTQNSRVAGASPTTSPLGDLIPTIRGSGVCVCLLLQYLGGGREGKCERESALDHL